MVSAVQINTMRAGGEQSYARSPITANIIGFTTSDYMLTGMTMVRDTAESVDSGGLVWRKIVDDTLSPPPATGVSSMHVPHHLGRGYPYLHNFHTSCGGYEWCKVNFPCYSKRFLFRDSNYITASEPGGPALRFGFDFTQCSEFMHIVGCAIRFEDESRELYEIGYMASCPVWPPLSYQPVNDIIITDPFVSSTTYTLSAGSGASQEFMQGELYHIEFSPHIRLDFEDNDKVNFEIRIRSKASVGSKWVYVRIYFSDGSWKAGRWLYKPVLGGIEPAGDPDVI
jgi:hypothetical protein